MYYIAHLIIEAGLAVLLVCAAFVIITAIIRALRRPPRSAHGVRVFTIVAVSGDAEGLEQTVRTLGSASSAIVIADCGLSPEARQIAEILAGGDTGAELCAPGDIPGILGDCKWTGENTYA